ncbi:hypothetical protein LZ32DRAFT_242486 [Colletotrichum eremochloae]|nr:hypothetical protein LZ32DRAFT_242486 [Colletotrichum eremochloae]
MSILDGGRQRRWQRQCESSTEIDQREREREREGESKDVCLGDWWLVIGCAGNWLGGAFKGRWEFIHTPGLESLVQDFFRVRSSLQSSFERRKRRLGLFGISGSGLGSDARKRAVGVDTSIMQIRLARNLGVGEMMIMMRRKKRNGGRRKDILRGSARRYSRYTWITSCLLTRVNKEEQRKGNK